MRLFSYTPCGGYGRAAIASGRDATAHPTADSLTGASSYRSSWSVQDTAKKLKVRQAFAMWKHLVSARAHTKSRIGSAITTSAQL